jgi:dipeptidyl aminopeptidase/acylaminoacyl peptidase
MSARPAVRGAAPSRVSTGSAGQATTVLRDLLRATTTSALDTDGRRLLLRTDAPGVDQLAEWADGAQRPLTAFGERVVGALYRPGHRQVVLESDTGGDERTRLFLLNLDGPVARDRDALRALTPDPAVHRLAGVTRDGRTLAYVSNRRDGIAFDAWLLDLDSGEDRFLYGDGGWLQPAAGFSPDGRWLTVLRPGPRPLDTDLLLLDTATGQARVVLPHPDEAATVGAPAWVDAMTLLVSSDVGRDRRALVRVDLVTDSTEVVVEREWDVAGWTSPDGSVLLAVSNVDGASAAELLDARTLAARGGLALPDPDTVVAWSHLLPDPLVGDDGRVVVTAIAPALPADVWRLHPDAAPTRLTESRLDVDRDALVRPTRHTVTSSDGVRVPLALYRPAGEPDAPPPVVVLLHGGPEGQSQPVFSPVVQALAAHGYAVVVPNVRGSTGYGKRYASLDDTTRRLESLRDLEAVSAWLAEAGLDPSRAALWGASYGGYLVLAGCAFQPDLWAAGVDVVGISDLVTFLERTADYRRAHREREYGSLVTDREFLAAASPLRRADAIRAPLFVVHGANDPRVPLAEAEQLVAALRERGVPCELLVYGDEGHGLSRLENRLDAYPRALAFLDRVLRP